MQHPPDAALERLTLGRLRTAESLRLQRHLFGCPDCLERLVEIEVALTLADVVAPPARLRPDLRKPLFICHDTADGLVYARVERRGRQWVERHWGEQLAGEQEFRTMREANTHALVAFGQMFPEHRCTGRCAVNPRVEEPNQWWPAATRQPS